MLKEPITVHVQAQVAGPGGIKLVAGKVHTLEDSPYVRVLIKSGSVTLIDPPSLDLYYLKRAGYELRDGYFYPDFEEVEEEVKKPVEEKTDKPVEAFLTKFPKKLKVSEEIPEEASDEKADPEDGEAKE